jgi:hypothetical protein
LLLQLLWAICAVIVVIHDHKRPALLTLTPLTPLIYADETVAVAAPAPIVPAIACPKSCGRLSTPSQHLLACTQPLLMQLFIVQRINWVHQALPRVRVICVNVIVNVTEFLFKHVAPQHHLHEDLCLMASRVGLQCTLQMPAVVQSCKCSTEANTQGSAMSAAVHGIT